MGLSVIAGPPGSGRERDRRRLRGRPRAGSAAGRADQRRRRPARARALRRPGAGFSAASITSFPGLFDEVARATGVDTGPPLTRMQRIWLAREATASTRLRRLARSSRREGFAPALEGLIADLQAAGLDAAALAAAADAADDGAIRARARRPLRRLRAPPRRRRGRSTSTSSPRGRRRPSAPTHRPGTAAPSPTTASTTSPASRSSWSMRSPPRPPSPSPSASRRPPRACRPRGAARGSSRDELGAAVSRTGLRPPIPIGRRCTTSSATCSSPSRAGSTRTAHCVCSRAPASAARRS